jgi:hypothetical protein
MSRNAVLLKTCVMKKTEIGVQSQFLNLNDTENRNLSLAALKT